MGLPVYVSPGATVQGSPSEDFVLLVDPAGVIVADEGETEISTSGKASLQMESEPLDGAQSLVSLWQRNLSGLKLVRVINWSRRRDAAVVVLRHVVR